LSKRVFSPPHHHFVALIEEPPLGIATWHFFAALTAIVYRAAAISRIIFCTSVGGY